jgi:hypothetical protein
MGIQMAGRDAGGTVRTGAITVDLNGAPELVAANNGSTATAAETLAKLGTSANLRLTDSAGNTQTSGVIYQNTAPVTKTDGATATWTAANILNTVVNEACSTTCTITTPTASAITTAFTANGLTCQIGQSWTTSVDNKSSTYAITIQSGSGVTITSVSGASTLSISPNGGASTQTWRIAACGTPAVTVYETANGSIGGTNLLTLNTVPKGAGANSLQNSNITDNGTTTTVAGSGGMAVTGGPLAVGSGPPAVTGTGIVGIGESTGQACASGADCIIANSSAHQALLSNNNATAVPIAVTPATTTNNNIPVYSGTAGSTLGAGITPGTGVATALAANVTGSGGIVLASSPTLTTAVLGSSTATTQSACDNSTTVATTAYLSVVCSTTETSGSPLSATSQSQMIWNNTAGAYVVDLPATANGLVLCVGNDKARSGAVSFVPPSGSTIYYKGVAGTTSSATGLVSGGAAGDFICVQATDSTTWMAVGAGQGTFTNN